MLFRTYEDARIAGYTIKHSPESYQYRLWSRTMQHLGDFGSLRDTLSFATKHFKGTVNE